jgi:hypothetical protein
MHESSLKMENMQPRASQVQNASQDATHVQMSKLDTLQLHNHINFLITKFHNH